MVENAERVPDRGPGGSEEANGAWPAFLLKLGWYLELAGARMAHTDPTVAYTRHARQKFEVLKRHGLEITAAEVELTVLSPEKVESYSEGRFIAQRGITDRHVLRVVYREEGGTRVVITFYPGRRDRYESQL